MHALFSAWRPSPALVLESFEVSLDHQAHLLEPLWHCMVILALVLRQNSHLSPMPHCCWFWSAWGSCKLLCGRNKWEQAEVAVRKESTCKSTRPSSSPHLKTEVMSYVLWALQAESQGYSQPVLSGAVLLWQAMHCSKVTACLLSVALCRLQALGSSLLARWGWWSRFGGFHLSWWYTMEGK